MFGRAISGCSYELSLESDAIIRSLFVTPSSNLIIRPEFAITIQNADVMTLVNTFHMSNDGVQVIAKDHGVIQGALSWWFNCRWN